MNIKIFLQILFSVFLTYQIANAQSSESHMKSGDFYKPVEALRIKANIPGLALTTFTSKGIQTSYSSGLTTLGTPGTPILAASHLFPVASVSKLFTTIGIFQLIQRNVFQLDTPLSELKKTLYYQVVKTQCPQRISMLEKMNISHLLSHQGGIGQDTPGANLWWDVSAIEDGAYPSFKDFIRGFCSTDELLEPGKAPLYKYSNAGFNLLGQIIVAYGQTTSLENYVYQNILHPLEMKNTFYQLTAEQAEKNLVFSHGNMGTDATLGQQGRRILPKVLSPESYEGSIGVNSTAHDLAQLGIALLSWTSPSDGRQLENPVTNLAKIWEKILQPVSRSSKTASITHGFMLYDTKDSSSPFHINGYICYGHTGTGYGSRSILYVCPELDWGFAALFNTRDVNRESFLKTVSQILNEKGLLHAKDIKNPKLAQWLSDVRKFHSETTEVISTKPAKAEIKDIPENLRPFVGFYVSGVVGDIEVSVSVNKKLMIRNVELDQENVNLFRYPLTAGSNDVKEPVVFVRDCEKCPVKGMIQARVLFAPKK